jgi:hypothetical protein
VDVIIFNFDRSFNIPYGRNAYDFDEEEEKQRRVLEIVPGFFF